VVESVTVPSSGITPSDGALSAGAGRALIALPGWVYPLEGFGGEHDALSVRVLLLDDGDESRLALVVVEMTSLPGQLLDELLSIVSAATAARRDRVAVVPTHTFSAPHLPPRTEAAPAGQREQLEELRRAVQRATRTAAEQAARTLRPARIGFGVGSSWVNVNRDMPTADGWWLGANDSGPSDKTVGVVRVEDATGAPIAVIANYAVQSSVMARSTGPDGLRLVTSDLAGAATRHVEEQYGGGTVAFFLIGAAGDQAPYLTAVRHVMKRTGAVASVDSGAAGFCLLTLLGERLGTEIVRVSEGIAQRAAAATITMITQTLTLPAQVAPRTLDDIRPSRAYEFRPNGETATLITAVRIGDLAIAGVQPELSAATGMEIKRRSPFRHTQVVTMFNGGAKYMADADSYDRITYEAMNSRFARGSAETLIESLNELLTRLTETNRRC
jgi:hypothetical protein